MKKCLIIIGSPLWVSLLLAAAAVAITLYAVIWVLVACLYVVMASFAVCGIAFVIYAFSCIFAGEILIGIALIGAGAVLAGLSPLMFFGNLAAAKGVVSLTKKAADLRYVIF